MAYRIVISVISVLATLLSIAWAQSNRYAVFTVPQVPVFAEAETSSEAQRVAQATGRRRAMDILLRRLTAEEDWVYLPILSRNEPAPAAEEVLDRAPETMVPNFSLEDAGLFGFDEPADLREKQPITITDTDLAEYEEGFGIFDEKTSGRTYRAKITYRFKPDSIRRILEMANLPYSEAQARRALILPVLQTEQDLYLWETKNPWARAWLARPLVNELTPMLLPLGDRQDIEVATSEDVLTLIPEALSPIADRYNTRQIIVAVGKLSERDDQYLLEVKLIDGYLQARDKDIQQFDPSTADELYDDEEFYQPDRSSSTDLGQRGRVLAEAIFSGPNDDFPALAQRAVETIVAKYANGWKSRTLVDHSAVRPLSLTAWFSSLDEWAEIRRALEETPLVRTMKVDAFNNENAVMQLSVLGEQDQFILAMRQENLTVWQDASGNWNIANPERATRVQAQLESVALGQRRDPRTSDPRVNKPGRRGPLGSTPQEDIPTLPDEFFGDLARDPSDDPNDGFGFDSAPVALESVLVEDLPSEDDAEAEEEPTEPNERF